MHIMKSDDVDADCAKSERKVVIEVPLAPSLAMHIISTLGMGGYWKRASAAAVR